MTSFRKFFGRLLRREPPPSFPPGSRAAELLDENLLARVRPFTMTSVERMHALLQAVDYVTANGLPGAFVECGVWRGGSMMLAALRLLKHGDTTRDLFLFDTFEGMPPPTAPDLQRDGTPAAVLLNQEARNKTSLVWAFAELEDVRQNLLSTGYPAERLHFIRGKVEETIPDAAPSSIALLRLDTDWYESTLHELTHLYPRMGLHCPLIIDDYGHWQGARQAVDEYFSTRSWKPILHRIDDTGRLIIKADE